MKILSRVCLFLLLSSAAARAEAVRFWTAIPEPDHAVMAELVDRYNEKHSAKPVDYENFPSRALLLKALKGNDLPNLALIDSSWIPELKDKLTSADDILTHAGEMVRAVAKADTFRPIWDTCVVDDKAAAIPFSAETAALVLNPAHFKKAPKVSTLSQWQKTAAGVKKNPVIATPVVLPSSWEKPELGKLWTSFAISGSVSPFWKKKSQDHPLTLHDEMAALNAWWNWVNRSKVMSVPDGAPARDFIHGAMWILVPRDVESLNSPVVVRSLPNGKRPWSFLRVDALGFFDNGSAWDFANYLTDYPQIKAWSMKTPTVPVNKQVYLSPDYIQDMDGRRPWMRTYIAAVSRVPRDLDFSEARLTEVGETVLQTLNNEIKVQDGAAKIHDSLFGMSESKSP